MKSKPTTVSELYPSRFITNKDLNKKSYELVISEVKIEKMRSKFTNKDEWKAVVYFENTKKGLVLNKGQAFSLENIAGSGVFENWNKSKVQLVPGLIKGKHTIFIKRPSENKMNGV